MNYITANIIASRSKCLVCLVLVSKITEAIVPFYIFKQKFQLVNTESKKNMIDCHLCMTFTVLRTSLISQQVTYLH